MGTITTRYVPQPNTIKGLDGKAGAPGPMGPPSGTGIIEISPITVVATTNTIKLDLSTSRKFRIVISHNFTLEFNDVIEDGGKFSVTIIQGGAGGYTLTLPTTVRWPNGNVAPTISDAVGEHTTYGFEAWTAPPNPDLKYDAFLIGTKI